MEKIKNILAPEVKFAFNMGFIAMYVLSFIGGWALGLHLISIFVLI
jgi:hypothetical protein